MTDRLADDDYDAEVEASLQRHDAEVAKEVAAIDAATVRPMHDWNDPDGDGHTCVDCPPESIWKCDERAHDTIVDPIERILVHHLPIALENGDVFCMCLTANNPTAAWTGPVYHRRHVVGIIRAHLEGRL
jgi:hypothetical protein